MNQDAKRTANLRANAMPVDGYVLSVDGKLKTRYENSSEAMAAALILKQSFPAIQVAVYDAAQRINMVVSTQELTPMPSE